MDSTSRQTNKQTNTPFAIKAWKWRQPDGRNDEDETRKTARPRFFWFATYYMYNTILQYYIRHGMQLVLGGQDVSSLPFIHSTATAETQAIYGTCVRTRKTSIQAWTSLVTHPRTRPPTHAPRETTAFLNTARETIVLRYNTTPS